MLVALWVVVALGVAVIYLVRPFIAISVIVSSLIFLPQIAVGLLPGSLGHPAVFLSVTTFVAHLIVRPLVVWDEVMRRGQAYFLLATALAVLIAATYLGNGLQGLTEFISQFFAPICLSVLISTACRKNLKISAALRNLLLLFGVVQVLLSIIAIAIDRPIFYSDQYSMYYWYEPTYTRALGTFDHPLILALFLLVCTGLAGTVRRWYVKFPLLAVFAAGMFLTESRAGLVLCIIVFFLIITSSKQTIDRKYYLLMGTVIVSLLLGTSSLAANTVYKFSDDSGSSDARFKALDVYLENFSTYLLHGVGDASEFAYQQGLATSLESAFLIYSVEYGVLFAVLYFSGALLMVFPRPLTNWRHPYVFTSIASILMVQTFSSLAASGAASMLLWLIIGLASAVMHRSSDGDTAAYVDVDARASYGLNRRT